MVAHDGTADQLDGEVEIAHHLPQHGELRRVLLSEVGAIRLHDVEELGDHGRDADEVAGTRNTIQPIGDGPWIHGSRGYAGAMRIHLVRRGSEEEMRRQQLELGTVLGERCGDTSPGPHWARTAAG